MSKYSEEYLIMGNTFSLQICLCAQEINQIFARSLSPKGANDEEKSRYVVEVETTNKKFKRMWRPGSGQFKYTTRYGLKRIFISFPRLMIPDQEFIQSLVIVMVQNFQN